MATITRNFAHRTFGAIGSVVLEHNCDVMKIDGKVIPGESIEYLLNFALQSLQDAYAGAKTQDEATAMFAKKRDAVVGGTIGARSAGGNAVSEATKVARSIVRALLKAKWGAKSTEWAEFTGLSDADADAKLDDVFAKNADKLKAKVDARVAELAAEREAKRNLASGVSLDL
jgi:hypothetical protein